MDLEISCQALGGERRESKPPLLPLKNIRVFGGVVGF